MNCHSEEQSDEESRFFCYNLQFQTQILRFAQNDMRLPTFRQQADKTEMKTILKSD